MENVDFNRRIIKIVETRVYGEEGRPKTNSSYRDIDMMPMVYSALKEQELRTRLRGKYVFLNQVDKPIVIETLENLGWVQKMMGHSSLKMITDKYFSYIPNMTHQDGSKFIEEYEKRDGNGQRFIV